jgi:hypothetical protein
LTPKTVFLGVLAENILAKSEFLQIQHSTCQWPAGGKAATPQSRPLNVDPIKHVGLAFSNKSKQQFIIKEY